METIFRLRFLGTVQIERNGKPVRGFRSRKALAILGYLVAQNRPVPREQLADLFWEDKPEATGRANLSWTLNKLASLLPGCLQTDRHTVQFQRADSYWLDVDAFAALEVQEDAASLASAVELARGEFLSGMDLDRCAEFDIWLVGERERWRQRVVRVLDELVAHHSRHGEYAQSLHFAQHLLTLEPWREETHRRVMRLLAQCGQRAAALAQYQACRRVMTQELSLEPTEETTALYKRIRAAALRRHTHGVPLQPTPLVGREKALANIARLLDNPDCRLLTLVGPGGIGKTRLALQAAAAKFEAFLEGVYFVSLTDASCIGSLVSVMADALDLSFSGQDPQVQLVDYLREKQVLLILDSFEHLLPRTHAKEEESEDASGGVRLLAEILQQVPEVKLLVTSRQRLNLSWEWCFEVEGLEYPNRQSADSQDWASYGAVNLFQQVARRVRRDLTLSDQDRSAIVRICELVEGMPLGIELAAAWVRMRTCEEIAREIESNLGFLATPLQDVPDRHRSVRATFEHSWRLLTPSEQDTLMKLSAFHRGFSRQAADQVAGASQAVLESLVDKSLLRSMPPGRYDLHELLRQYAAEKLAAVPETQSAVADRHCAYYLALLQRHEADLATTGMAQALMAIKTESENVRAAWCWAATQTKLDEIERSVNSLSRFYTLAGPYQEGEAAIRLAVEHVRALIEKTENPHHAGRAILGKLLAEQARFLNGQGMHSQAIAAAQASLAVSETAGLQAEGHLQWGQALWYQRDYQAAQTRLEQALSLAQSAILPQVEADCLNSLGKIRWHLSDYARAGAYVEQALSIFRNIGDRKGEGESLISFGRVCAYQDDYAGAGAYFEQALRVLHEIGDRRGESLALVDLGLACNLQGDYAQARKSYQQALRISREIGDRSGQSRAHINLGYVSDQLGDYAGARACYRQTLRISHETGDRQGESFALACLCLLAHHLGEDRAACEYGQQALLIAQDIGNRHVQGYVLTRLGHALAGLERWTEATETYRQALALRRELNQPNLAMEPLAGLARVELAQGHLAQARVHVAEILDRLEAGPLNGVDEPFRVCLTCYRVLEVAQENSLARTVLSKAHRLLQERAARISDEKLRRSFLENVTVHREIVEAVTFHRQLL